MGVRAKCSRCDYLRTFADDLRGTFYRCPKCRAGVIAVPQDASSSSPAADETPPGAFFGARKPDEVEARDDAQDDADDEAALASDVAQDVAEAGEEPATPELVTPAPDEKVPFAASGSGSGSGEAPAPEAAARAASARKRAARKKSVKVKRILVECALCGYHVAVPPELFGKTVHCPECRADLMFSESSLEPVKDEIIGRIALEHMERNVLDANPIGAPIGSPEVARRARRTRIAIVLIVTGALAAGTGAFVFRLLTATRPRPQSE